jgi:hypothetical protein
MEVTGQLHVLSALPQGKEPTVLDRRLGGFQSRYGRCGEEKIFAPVGNRTPIIAIPTELSRLLLIAIIDRAKVSQILFEQLLWQVFCFPHWSVGDAKYNFDVHKYMYHLQTLQDSLSLSVPSRGIKSDT